MVSTGVAPGSRYSRRHVAAWPALFVAPLAFAINLAATYPLVPWVCAHQRHAVLHVVEAVFLVIALFGMWHGARLWREHAGAKAADAGDHGSQRHFLGVISTFTSALFA